MNTLALDLGTKHIGIAISQSSLATPLATLTFSSPQKLIEQLTLIIRQHQINQLVIGLPSGPLAQFVHQLKKILVQAFPQLEIHLADETLTSQEASLKLLHKKRSLRKKLSHATAAALILQSWLDYQPQTTQNI